MRKRLIVFVVLSLAVIFTTAFWAIPYVSDMPYQYKGTLAFNSESEYAQFKQALIDAEADWSAGDITILSSEPPIIVKFERVKIDKSFEFPYGEQEEAIPIWSVVVTTICGFLFLCLMVEFSCFLLYDCLGGEK